MLLKGINIETLEQKLKKMMELANKEGVNWFLNQIKLKKQSFEKLYIPMIVSQTYVKINI